MDNAALGAGGATLRDTAHAGRAVAREYPRAATLHHLVSAQAGATPEAVALIFEGDRLSYGELEGRSNRPAHELRALGAGPGRPVAPVGERSLAMLVDLLGFLTPRAPLLPSARAYPGDRLG